MTLRRKMLRDMRANAGSYLACLALVVIGVVAFLSFSIARDNMVLSKESLYREENFADGFAELAAMPEHRLRKIRRMAGIRQASGRLIRDVQVHDPEREASVYLRLVSLDLEETDRLNDVRLLEGEPLSDKEMRCWIDGQFFEANRLELDQELEIIAGGRTRELVVSGVGICPEFVYPLRTESEIYVNPEQFGVAFLPDKIMWSLFPEMDRAFNSLAFSLEDGAEFQDVKEELEIELERYGVIEVYPREDQTSHFILTEEIEVIGTMATFFPVMILSIAAFIIYIVLKRLVEQQRGQIGILKAFGYSSRAILLHYFSYSLTLALIGGAAGGLIGMWLAGPLTDLLYEFFHLPEVYAGFSVRHLLLSLGICLAVLGFGGYHGCKTVLRLEPAEAMRPPAPKGAKKFFLEKIPFFTSILTIQGKMAIRNLFRSRSRTAFVFLGIAVSCAMVAFTWALATESMPKFMFQPYQEVMVYDARVNLENPRPRKAGREELERLAEVARAEPLVEIPVKLIHRWREENVAAIGLLPESRLYNILDKDGNRIVASDDGLILSERLAENLGAAPGSTLELESIFLRDPDRTVKVAVVAVVPQYIGMNAYMGIAGLEDLLRRGEFATAFLVETAPGPGTVRDRVAGLRERYRESDFVAGVDEREDLVALMEEQWETAGWVINLYVLIGVIFSFSIIYVSSLIVLSERNRELASLRVLGMTSREVFSVITFEQWFLAFFAVIAGLPLARLIMNAFARQWSTDMYAMPAEMSAGSWLAGIAMTVISIWAAQRFTLRKIKRLEIVEALKTGE